MGWEEFVTFVSLFTVSPVSTYSAKYTWHLNKVIIIIIIIITQIDESKATWRFDDLM